MCANLSFEPHYNKVFFITINYIYLRDFFSDVNDFLKNARKLNC